MRLALLVVILFMVAIFATIDMPAHSSVPPNSPQPMTDCQRYVAMPPEIRIRDWNTTLHVGLKNSPEVSEAVWACAMDKNKILDIDKFILRSCTNDLLSSSFQAIALEALEVHLKRCFVSINR